MGPAASLPGSSAEPPRGSSDPPHHQPARWRGGRPGEVATGHGIDDGTAPSGNGSAHAVRAMGGPQGGVCNTPGKRRGPRVPAGVSRRFRPAVARFGDGWNPGAGGRRFPGGGWRR
jgi:hypothetical protein